MRWTRGTRDLDPRHVADVVPHPNAPYADRLLNALAAGMLAPSIHNSQPWIYRVSASGTRIELIADRSRLLRVLDPQGRQLEISCGASLENFCLALGAAGLTAQVTSPPNPRGGAMVAVVDVASSARPTLPDHHELALATQIPVRETSRRPFAPRPLEPDEKAALVAAGTREGVRVVELTGEARQLATRLARAAHREQQQDPALTRETLSWTRPPATTARDGVLLERVADPAIGSAGLEVPYRDFLLRRGGQREPHTRQGEAAASLFLIESDGDDMQARVASGRALERLLLEATLLGLDAGYAQQGLEVPRLRWRLREELGIAGHPQLLLRVGHVDVGWPPHTPRSPRRFVHDVARFEATADDEQALDRAAGTKVPGENPSRPLDSAHAS